MCRMPTNSSRVLWESRTIQIIEPICSTAGSPISITNETMPGFLTTSELMMPNSIGKTTLHEETSDAGGEMARTIRETEASRKTVRDAAEASREAHRGDEAIGETAERVSEAVERIVSEAADASQQMAERAAEEFDQMLIRRIEASKEMIQTT